MGSIRRVVLALVAFQLAGHTGSATDAATTKPARPLGSEESGIDARLQRKIPEVKFDDVAFADVLDFLRDVTGINITVNWQSINAAGIPKEARVTCRLYNVRASKAIRVILDCVSTKDTSLHWEVDAKSNSLAITTYDDYVAHNTENKEYDVGDLVGNRTPEDQDRLRNDLSKLIRETVASDSWVTEGGKPGVIKVKEGRLIITQTRENHRQVEILMAQLRETHKHQVQQLKDGTRSSGATTRPVR